MKTHLKRTIEMQMQRMLCTSIQKNSNIWSIFLDSNVVYRSLTERFIISIHVLPVRISSGRNIIDVHECSTADHKTKHIQYVTLR